MASKVSGFVIVFSIFVCVFAPAKSSADEGSSLLANAYRQMKARQQAESRFNGVAQPKQVVFNVPGSEDYLIDLISRYLREDSRKVRHAFYGRPKHLPPVRASTFQSVHEIKAATAPDYRMATPEQ